MDLGDLNIVAIAPTPQEGAQGVQKKKKNNKYERRRQKAAKAKRQQGKTGGRQVSQHKDHKTSSDASKDPPQETESTKQTKEKPSEETSTNDNEKTASADSVENAVTTKKETSSTPQVREIEIERIEVSSDEKDVIAPASPLASEVEPEVAAAVEPSRKRRPKDRDGVNADQEHAKYMAEFHARPMELDRRSGARPSKVLSRKSNHLFMEDQKDWKALNLHPRLIQTMDTKFKLSQPTSVQSRTIQTILDVSTKQKNVLIHSETGSGKTLAFMLPILQQIGFSPDGSTLKMTRKQVGTKCIIICPTRELASQTLSVVENLCQANFAGWVVPGGLLGGDSRNSEKARVRKGLGIIVATPGRLLDHLNRTESLLLNLKGKLNWLVLDEADHLLDMGLGDQVKQIVQLIRANEASKSQPWWRSVLVSATVTPSVQALAKERMLCGDQAWIWVKGSGNELDRKRTMESRSQDDPDMDTTSDRTEEKGYAESTPRQLAQFHVTVTAKLRLSTLVAFLVQRVSKGERTVVFMGTCACVDFHHKLLQAMEPLWAKDEDSADASRNGLFGDKAQIFKLHGNVQHSKRNQTLKLFDKAQKGAILLTTDVSARGLNLEGVDWTVQYDPPCEIADYVHRVGRVARAGKAGHSLLFLLPSEKGYLDVLQTKGISNLEPLSLSNTLNTAASLCTDWTNAGLKFGGNKEVSTRGNGTDGFRGSRFGEHFASEVQRRMEDIIVQDNEAALRKWKEEKKEHKKLGRKTPSNKSKEGELMELARDAFMSYLRAYPTKKEAAVRSIFSARALHVGHVARSFALKDPPKSLVSKHKQSRNKLSEMEAMDQESNRPKALQFNPYENNLVSLSDDEDNDEGNMDNADFETRGRRSKRPRLQGSDHTPKNKNARTLLLQNAMKMQTNLMDAM